MKLLLIASSGGHFYQMYSLKRFWEEQDRAWITFPANDTKYLLKEERVIWAHFPTNRNIPNLIKNIFLAIKVIRGEKPDLVISTGAGVSVPFLLIAKLKNIKTAYIESMTRTSDLSLSGRILYNFVDRFFVQWPELTQKYKKAQYKGQVV